MESALKSLFFRSTPVDRIRKNIRAEIARMTHAFPPEYKDSVLLDILKEADLHLKHIKNDFKSFIIDPSLKIALSDITLPQAFYNWAPRVGFYPISANPIHWGHLLVGLSAIAHYKLDKVVFVISGQHSKKQNFAPVEWRHQMSKEVLALFAPLFEYSDIAKNNSLDGESNVFKILNLNPFQKIDAFYMVGTDHYYRTDPKKGNGDTIEKLEENIALKLYNYSDMFHSISVIFAKRPGGSDIPVETSLNVKFLPPLKFTASSTHIRSAFTPGGNKDALALLPFTAYQYIRSKGGNAFFENNPAVLNPSN